LFLIRKKRDVIMVSILGGRVNRLRGGEKPGVKRGEGETGYCRNLAFERERFNTSLQIPPGTQPKLEKAIKGRRAAPERELSMLFSHSRHHCR